MLKNGYIKGVLKMEVIEGLIIIILGVVLTNQLIIIIGYYTPQKVRQYLYERPKLKFIYMFFNVILSIYLSISLIKVLYKIAERYS